MTDPAVTNPEDQRMHPRKTMFLALALVAALAVIAPSAVAASGTHRPSSHGGNLHVTKECSAYTGAAGGYCTITSSNLWAIPVGSRVIYEHALVYPIADTNITLDPPGKGDMAFGHVRLDLGTGLGTVTFTGGTGHLAGFSASAAVTPNPAEAFGWSWDGTYSFSRDNFYLDKTCGPSPDPIGYQCAVAHSGFRLFPAGTVVHYAATADPSVVRATITIPRGSTTGLCVWSSAVNAVCTFRHGTGRLDGFRLRVVVTANADASVWYWNGTYGFAGDREGGRSD